MNLDVEALLVQARPSFRPWAYYHQKADSLQVFVENQPTIRRRVDDVLTVYETADGEFGGCQLKGVTALLHKWGGSFGFEIRKGRKVKASLVVMAYVMCHPESLEHGPALRRILETADCEIELAAA